MQPHEQPCDHLVSVMKKPEVKTRLIAMAANLLRSRGLDGSMDGLAQDAYAIALRKVADESCNYDPNRPAEPFLTSAVLNAARDIANSEHKRPTVPLEAAAYVPAPPSSHSPEMPALDLITEALQNIRYARYQAVAARITVSQLPSDEALPPALLLMAQGHPPSEPISRCLKMRSLDAFRLQLDLLRDPETRISSALRDRPPSQHS